AEPLEPVELCAEWRRRVHVALSSISGGQRSEEHTSELQSREKIVCRLLLEKKNKITLSMHYSNPKVMISCTARNLSQRNLKKTLVLVLLLLESTQSAHVCCSFVYASFTAIFTLSLHAALPIYAEPLEPVELCAEWRRRVHVALSSISGGQ